MAINSTLPGHDYKVFFSVEPNKRRINDEASLMLKFQCNVRITRVSEGSDASLPTHIKDHDSWHYFHLPYDLLTCGDNFSSFQPRIYIAHMLHLMKIPFELDRLFWKQSHEDKESVPLGSPDDIETLILDAACAMVDAIGGSEDKGLSLLVTVEKEVIVPREYVGMLRAQQDAGFCKVQDKGLSLPVTIENEVIGPREYVETLKAKVAAKQDAVFCKARDNVARMLQLEEQGQEFSKSEWDNMVNDLVDFGLSEGVPRSYVASFMKRVERTLFGNEQE